MQVLQGRWDRTFSQSSFGFRPGRSAHQAVRAAQKYIEEGHGWVVDMDLEKFFDRVNHDVLMGRVAKRVGDKRLLKLLRAFLNAGVMENGLESPSVEGTPQGGPLSPLLSNLLLDELDRELESRGHRFVRYADDCNIYVRSERAGVRVMGSVKAFLAKRLKLKVNEEKSAVGKAGERKFLSFRFLSLKVIRRAIAPEALVRFRRRVARLTRRTRGVSLEKMVRDLTPYLTGWRNYFGFCQTPSVLGKLDSWTRRRLRCAVWHGWKLGKKRFAELRKRGVGKVMSAKTAGSCRGPWRLSASPVLTARRRRSSRTAGSDSRVTRRPARAVDADVGVRAEDADDEVVARVHDHAGEVGERERDRDRRRTIAVATGRGRTVIVRVFGHRNTIASTIVTALAASETATATRSVVVCDVDRDDDEAERHEHAAARVAEHRREPDVVEARGTPPTP